MAAAKGKTTKSTTRNASAKQTPEDTNTQDTPREDSAPVETTEQAVAESETQSSGGGEAGAAESSTEKNDAPADAGDSTETSDQGDTADHQEEATGEAGKPSTPAASYPGEDGKDVAFDTLWIKARKGGFRRAGYQFSEREEKEIAVEDLDEDQLAALLEEPQLIVTAGVKED